jgi:mannosyltransferase
VLVWYSQEARAYALLVLLSAAGLLAFFHALARPDRRRLLWWAAVSALALATHYPAAFVVAPQAAWLVISHPRRVGSWAATAAVAAVGGAELPLALAQRATLHTAWIGRIPLDLRLRQLGSQFLSGFDNSSALAAVVGAGAALGLLQLLRATPGERRAALAAAALGGAALLTAVAIVPLGADELLTRNAIPAWLPLALVVAIGLGGRRSRLAGTAATLAVCAAWIGMTISINVHAGLQRPDWRRVSRALGPARSGRLVVLEHYRPMIPLTLYRPDLVRMYRLDAPVVREVDVVAPDVPRGRSCWWGAACNLSPAPAPRPPPKFTVQGEVELPNFDVFRLAAAQAVRLPVRYLRRELRHTRGGAVLLERPAVRRLHRGGDAIDRAAAEA